MDRLLLCTLESYGNLHIQMNVKMNTPYRTFVEQQV